MRQFLSFLFGFTEYNKVFGGRNGGKVKRQQIGKLSSALGWTCCRKLGSPGDPDLSGTNAVYLGSFSVLLLPEGNSIQSEFDNEKYKECEKSHIERCHLLCLLYKSVHLFGLIDTI